MAAKVKVKTAFVVFRYVSKIEDPVDAVKLFFDEQSRHESVRWNVEVLSATLASGNVLLTGVVAAIKRADLVVVVAGEISHNVAFEMGIAHALNKDLILLAPAAIVREIPTTFSDIAGMKCAIYDPDRVMKIPDVLRTELAALANGRAKGAE